MFSLTFVYSPPSNTYGYEFVELIPNGAHIVSELRVRVWVWARDVWNQSQD